MQQLQFPIYPLFLIFIRDEEEYEKIATKMDNAGADVRRSYPFPGEGCGITVSISTPYLFIVLVAVGDGDTVSYNEMVNIITHESVHVKQYLFESIGEKNPGLEVEAYTVQYIARTLIKFYNKEVEKECKKQKKTR